MSQSHTRPYLLVISTLCVSIAALTWTVDVKVSDKAPVRQSFPERIGAWTGEDVFFCVNPEDGARFLAGELNGTTQCPKCGGPLRTGSYWEYAQLPEDTVIRKKQYTHPQGAVLQAGLVMSGRDRSSIHRPQVCLTGGGNEIVGDEILHMTTDEGETFSVMVLDLESRVTGPDGDVARFSSYYAYWFAGNRHETPYHLVRMFWMAADRVLQSTAYPWAYIAVSGPRRPGDDGHLDLIESFLASFHPRIQPGGNHSGG